MTTDEAIAYAEEAGWALSHLAKTTRGRWIARLYDTKPRVELWNGMRIVAPAGYSDVQTEFGEGETPADAIIASFKLRIDRKTGKVREATEAELRGFSNDAEMKLIEALQENIAAREQPQGDVSQDAYARLLAALEANKGARRGRSVSRA